MTKDYRGKKKQELDPVTAAANKAGNRPPHAPEIEEAVIGAMMIDSECVYPAIELLSERSFYTPKLRLIFKAILTLFNNRSAIDIMTVSEQLREDGVLDEVGGPFKLASLTTNVGSAANVEYYIKILQQKKIQRDLIGVGYGILKKAFDETYDVDRLMEESQTEVYTLISDFLLTEEYFCQYFR